MSQVRVLIAENAETTAEFAEKTTTTEGTEVHGGKSVTQHSR